MDLLLTAALAKTQPFTARAIASEVFSRQTTPTQLREGMVDANRLIDGLLDSRDLRQLPGRGPRKVVWVP